MRNNQYDELQPNRNGRYRLPPETAKRLGIEPKINNNRYTLTVEQEAVLFNYDQEKIKRLFFDIETTPYKGYFWNGYPKFIPHDMVEEEQKIICISYCWEGEDKVHRLNWENQYSQNAIEEIKDLLSKSKSIETKQICQKIINDYLFKGCDKKLTYDFIKIMNEADECIAHNGDRYDIKVLRTRAIFHRIPMFPKYKTLDTLKKYRTSFKFFSNKLDSIAKDLGVGAKLKHEGWSMWERCMKGDFEALTDMGNYCDVDIITLMDVFITAQNYFVNNTHTGVHNGKLKASCPNCGSEDVSLLKNNFTALGTIKRYMECNPCGYNYEISNTAWRNFLELKSNSVSM